MSDMKEFVQPAADFAHGALYLEQDGAWVRPWRVTPEQYRALSCAQAWHPGLYKQMAACTAGITLEFETCAREVWLELAIDALSAGSQKSLQLVRAAQASLQEGSHNLQVELEVSNKVGKISSDSFTSLGPHDAIAVEVDGQVRTIYQVPTSGQANTNPQVKLELIGNSFSESGDAPLRGAMDHIDSAATLAVTSVVTSASGTAAASGSKTESAENSTVDLSVFGMEFPRRVRVQLPLLRGCKFKNLISIGAPLTPIAHRQQLLVLGDSITQGFVAGAPHLSWPRLVADALDLELVNQGIGGQVVQPGSLPSAHALENPARIVIAFGANYRYEPYQESVLRRDIERYLSQVSAQWHQVPCWVVTPFWHVEEAWPTHARSVFAQVPDALAKSALRHAHMGLVDGLKLIDHSAELFADGFEHPNAQGNAQIADRLLKEMGAPGLPHARKPAKSTTADKHADQSKPTSTLTLGKNSAAEKNLTKKSQAQAQKSAQLSFDLFDA